MFEAKKRVIEYVNEIMDVNENNRLILDMLENFYLFLENLLERIPHKKGGIQKEQLEGLKIKNEYNVQHFLYAYLKPLYSMARAEVNEDTGYGTVRTDMVHYSSKSLYFFIQQLWRRFLVQWWR